MSDQLVTRRKSLKYLGLLAATAAGQEFLANWLTSSSKAWAASEAALCAGMRGMHQAAAAEEPAQPYTPQFFKPDEFATVEILTEMIIPTDDKPGAKEAQVANYIDFVVFSAAEFEPSLQREWTQGLAWLAQESKKRLGKSFQEATPSEREKLLTDMSLPERDSKAAKTHPGFAFYRLVKDMTVEGFFTSKVGLVGFLEYQGMAFLSEFPGCTHPEHQA
jgi:gluconate 2-dehydrogenase subunit 3-like protein